MRHEQVKLRESFDIIDTHTGRMSGGSALAQIFIVPVLLAAAILAIGLASVWILP